MYIFSIVYEKVQQGFIVSRASKPRSPVSLLFLNSQNLLAKKMAQVTIFQSNLTI